MPLFLFNTLTQSKELFTPNALDASEVSLYTCGPTVYNYVHIGNLRTFLFEDVLRRTLEYQGYTVKHVMNITDVGHLTDDADSGEDKMEKGARREGKTAWDIAQFYTQAFIEHTQAVNIKLPRLMPHAADTKYIQKQIELIEVLEKKGHTYITSDGVYFDTTTFADYGKMARLDIAGLQEGARVEKNTEKRNATDFALWKFSSKNTKRDMEWASPWGIGFPGWHIECSAMAIDLLGETIDIHCGGVDHIPVHHTNEIAQSESATGKQFARFWMHGEFLLINEGKMSKSAGNFITVATLKEKQIDPLAYRYFVLTAHYRSKLNFTWEAVAAAEHAYKKLISTIASWDPASDAEDEELLQRFMQAMNDDINTPQALAVLWELVKSGRDSSVKTATIKKIDTILGLSLLSRAQEYKKAIDTIPDEALQLLRDREQARTEKNYARSDELRDQIAALGFTIQDTPEGPKLELNQ